MVPHVIHFIKGDLRTKLIGSLIFPVEMSLMNTAEGGNLMTTAEGGNRWNAETHLPNVLLTSTANCRNWILF